MGRIHKFFRLQPYERRIFLRAVLKICLFQLALRKHNLQELLVGTPADQPGSLSGNDLSPRSLVRLIAAAGRFVRFSTCLSRALAARVLLREHGLSPTLHIGVARDPRKDIKAHAWLTLNGEIILGSLPDLEKYRELPMQNNGSTGPGP